MPNIYCIDKKLDFNMITGPDKGKVIKDIKESILEEFESYSHVPIIQIKGKHQKRIFWEVISIQNMAEVIRWISEYFKDLELKDNEIRQQ